MTLFQIGNLKLGKDTAIFNFTSATNCPAKRRGLCNHCDKCYAAKAEKQYPAVFPYRERQAAWYNDCTAEEFVAAFTKAQGKRRKVAVNHLRFSEAGDFTSQAQVDKFAIIARKLAALGITVYGYTARKDLDTSKLERYATVNGSNAMKSNRVHVMPAADIPADAEHVCECDCKVCDTCKTGSGKDIYFPIH